MRRPSTPSTVPRPLLLLLATAAALWLLAQAFDDSPDDGPVQPPDVVTSGSPPPAAELLRVTHLKDGDSWVASDGREYRLGLVNTPEPREPCFAEAAAFTRDYLAAGFTADAYTVDRYGRQVAEVRDARGRSLNVALTESGLADARYLDRFRREAPDLASRIDVALRSAAVPACRRR